MAYCDQCGAYIPDGQSKCLACGYDKTEKREKERIGTATIKEKEKRESGKYYSFTNEELKEKLEEQRKRQQEASRRWAEQERARRAAQEESWNANVQEKERDPQRSNRNQTMAETKNKKFFSIISYLGPLFLLGLLFHREDEMTQYHAKQGAVLFLYGIASEILSWIPVAGFMARLLFYIGIAVGIKNASQQKKEPLPVIGVLGERF